jgi:hypothetical protein
MEPTMKPNIQSRLDTATPYLKDLITEVKKGEIKIPQFQRKFVWKEDQALKLLDSLSSNYPIGSLLLWRTPVKLAVERNIGDFKLPATEDLTPTNYVLDGQQRLTVIYSCFGAPETEEGFAVAYDLKEEEFLELPSGRPAHIFPLRLAFNTTKLLNFRTGLLSLPDYQERLDTLIGALSNYKIPIVVLKDLTVEEVCPIFERINSSGTKLSTFDLMVAATWTQSFDLSKEVEQISLALDPKGFGDIERETVLKCLAAVRFGAVRERDVLALRNVDRLEMPELVETTRAALLRTVDLLSTEFKVYSWDFLPYEALALVLCNIFARAKHFSPQQTNRVRQWFWRSAFSERYRVGGESFVSNDLALTSDFIIGGEGEAKSFGSPPTQAEWLKVMFRSRNSRSRAYVLALAARGPRNITNGSLIDTADALSSFNQKQFHHIFPKAFLIKGGRRAQSDLIANICMLAASENNKISDSDPANYLPECITHLGTEADAVFASNLLPAPGDFNYDRPTLDRFLKLRAAFISEYAEALCDGVV